MSFATSVFLCGAVAHGAAVPQRIMVAIDASGLTQLPDNVPAQAIRSTDLGLAAANAPLNQLSIRFNRTDTQQKALTQLLLDQQNPSSPRYRQWLTPEQFGTRFGLAPADLQKVSDWLARQGFTVTQVARAGTFIGFSGTVAQAERAFHTQLHRVSLDGEIHVTNMTSPVLPSALAAVTAGITGLHDFRLKPHHQAEIAPAVSPAFTSSVSGNHFIAPGDFYTIYDENALLTGGIDGTGVTIAVLGQVDVNLADIATFRSVSGLSVNAPTVMDCSKLTALCPDPGPPGVNPIGPSNLDFLESELDLEWSGATAPSAHILFVNSNDVINVSLTQAIDNNVAPILSLSYGACETTVGLNTLNMFNGMLEQANAQGQTLVAAAGDSGVTNCELPKAAVATHGLGISFPALLPTATAIGGTMFNEGPGTFWSATNGANMGSALSYIPEAVWNEDATNGNLSSGGGGASVFFTKPYWQVGTGVPADSSRDIPDISFNAAVAHDGYLICTTDPTMPATPAFCTNGYRNSAGNLDTVGGT
ncbi:MAG: protease pro-enzyme activation domain-containing protein, partial [Acidobacteriota bacterium]|nr:protease pro-enzyme activation domain-containing protein [Acidobacteriota bacterium]